MADGQEMKRPLRIEIDHPGEGLVTVKVIDVATDIWASAKRPREAAARNAALEQLRLLVRLEKPCKKCGQPVEKARVQYCPECLVNYHRDYDSQRREKRKQMRRQPEAGMSDEECCERELIAEMLRRQPEAGVGG